MSILIEIFFFTIKEQVQSYYAYVLNSYCGFEKCFIRLTLKTISNYVINVNDAMRN